MREALQWLGFAFAAFAALFGASWAKKKLEQRGAKKQQDLQQAEADRVEAELDASDSAIDEETEAKVDAVEDRRAARHKTQAEAAKRSPTQTEIERFIEESKE